MTSDKENALRRLLDVLDKEPGFSEVFSMRSSQLAVLWPSLAAALADVMVAHDLQPAQSFRRAAIIVSGEARVVAQRAAALVRDGAWCFCQNGPNNDGRGHLRGEEGCGNAD